MSKLTTRRGFLLRSTTAAAAAAWAMPALAQAPLAARRLNLAVIGVDRPGLANLNGVATENIVGLCDVDENRLGVAAKRFAKAQRFVDFRVMLDKIHKQIDAVVVSTPDHTHAPAAVMAMKLGKHCYCEKPLTHSVHETRVVTTVAKQQKAVTQIGTQIHAGQNYRRVVEWVQSGAIGEVREVHVWVNVSYGADRPTDTPPVPEGLHWDLWLGPAPFRPYNPAYVPGKWRRWWDFGNGGLGDFGCHYMDLPFWALKLRCPTTIEAEGPPVHPESTPPWMIVRYEYAARGDLPPVKLTWYDGGRRPGEVRGEKLPDWKSAVLFVGQKGMLIADYNRHKLLPESKFKGIAPPARTIPDSIGHHKEWIEACKTHGTTTCAFDYSGPLTEAALLGTVAYRTGEKLQWDAEKLQAIHCPKADRYLRPEYRKGWTL